MKISFEIVLIAVIFTASVLTGCQSKLSRQLESNSRVYEALRTGNKSKLSENEQGKYDIEIAQRQERKRQLRIQRDRGIRERKEWEKRKNEQQLAIEKNQEMQQKLLQKQYADDFYGGLRQYFRQENIEGASQLVSTMRRAFDYYYGTDFISGQVPQRLSKARYTHSLSPEENGLYNRVFRSEVWESVLDYWYEWDKGIAVQNEQQRQQSLQLLIDMQPKVTRCAPGLGTVECRTTNW